MKKLLLLSVVFAISACSPQSPDGPARNTAPTETADEFVARMNEELRELRRELGAADWVRSTYITEDTGIIASAASVRYAEWHGRMVKESMAYDGHELYADTRRAMDQARTDHDTELSARMYQQAVGQFDSAVDELYGLSRTELDVVLLGPLANDMLVGVR